MEAYLRAFVNFEQNDWARLLPMAKFAYNNAKNASSGHTPFELNCGYHPRMSYEDDVDPRSKSKSADDLSAELRELMIVCRENLHHAQELQKRAHDKGVKPRSYAPSDKVWLNSKYIKIKRNQLPRKLRIHNVFHMSLLEQDTTRKGRMDENATELDAGDDEGGEYKVETIWDSAGYARKSADYLSGLYYLVCWKDYPEEENTWEPASAAQYLKKLISSFHKNHPNKLMASIKPTALKQKRGQPANSSNKQTKKSCIWFLLCFWPFHKVRVIHALKPLAWKSRDFLTDPLIEISILRAPTSTFWDRPLSIAASRTRRRFSSSVLLLG